MTAQHIGYALFALAALILLACVPMLVQLVTAHRRFRHALGELEARVRSNTPTNTNERVLVRSAPADDELLRAWRELHAQLETELKAQRRQIATVASSRRTNLSIASKGQPFVRRTKFAESSEDKWSNALAFHSGRPHFVEGKLNVPS